METDFQILAEATSGREPFSLVEKLSPHVVIMDRLSKETARETRLNHSIVNDGRTLALQPTLIKTHISH